MGAYEMKLAVLSDIHGNHIALRQCVEYALARDITTFIFLGDYLGELPYPQKTMKYLYDMQEKYTCYFIRGNRDEYWLNYRRGGESGWCKGNSASGALLYTYERLTAEDLAFFESLPIKRELIFPELPPLTICHGSPNRVNERIEHGNEAVYDIMKNDSSSYILCGHTHVQKEILYGKKTIWNPGAIGVPLYSGGKTQFMILHGEEHEWKKEFLSLSYDVDNMIEEITESGLDDYAPYWCTITKHVLWGEKIDPGVVLERAEELCTLKYGHCNWPDIPEECWEQAVGEFVQC